MQGVAVAEGHVKKPDHPCPPLYQRADRRALVPADDQIALLTLQSGVVEARRVLIALLGAAGMASGLPVVPAVPVTAYWEWPPAALLVAGPLIETRAKRIVG